MPNFEENKNEKEEKFEEKHEDENLDFDPSQYPPVSTHSSYASLPNLKIIPEEKHSDGLTYKYLRSLRDPDQKTTEWDFPEEMSIENNVDPKAAYNQIWGSYEMPPVLTKSTSESKPESKPIVDPEDAFNDKKPGGQFVRSPTY